MGNGIENTLYYGDNLQILREHIADSSIDLIYLDPPFQSGRNYNVLFEEKNGTSSRSQIKAFKDTWHWDMSAEETYREIMESKISPAKLIELIQGLKQFLSNNDMMAYLVMMAIRLVELHRVLKDTGSIYLHCDPTASHYLKLVIDAIFGGDNFQNEIVWCYRGGGVPRMAFARKHDILLFYSKTNTGSRVFNTQYVPYSEASQKLVKSRGGTSIDGKIRNLERGAHMPDWWFDINSLQTWSPERLPYETQKPEAILERIITASSNEGDIVLDPFCGCGTTVNVAERLKRKWIGIDITHLAIGLIKHRLLDTFGDKVKYKVKGEPEDYASAKALAEHDKFQFECWASGKVGARKEKQMGADRGIDGIIFFYDEGRTDEKIKKIIVQVKGGHIGVSQIRDLKGTVEREKAQIGAFITLEEPTQPMKTEAASAGFYECPFNKSKYPKLQILTIKELFEGKKLDYPPWREDATLKKAQKYTEIPKHTQQKLIED